MDKEEREMMTQELGDLLDNYHDDPKMLKAIKSKIDYYKARGEKVDMYEKKFYGALDNNTPNINLTKWSSEQSN